LLPPTEQPDGLFTAAATDLGIRLKRSADSRSLGQAEQTAQVFDRKMDATFSCPLAVRHTGNRRTDGRGNATGATAFTAVHDDKLLATGKVLNDAS